MLRVVPPRQIGAERPEDEECHGEEGEQTARENFGGVEGGEPEPTKRRYRAVRQRSHRTNTDPNRSRVNQVLNLP